MNIKICRFALSKVTFLGHMIGSGRHRPDPEKVRAVEHYRLVRLSLIIERSRNFFSYFRMYLPNFACIARPLTDLTIVKAS